jgi:hypothetical protein
LPELAFNFNPSISISHVAGIPAIKLILKMQGFYLQKEANKFWKKTELQTFGGQQVTHAHVGFSSWGSWSKTQKNHRCVQGWADRREHGRQRKSQETRVICHLMPFLHSSSEVCLKNTEDTSLCTLPLEFLILFEGGQNNDLCSLLASSAESFKSKFLLSRPFLTNTSSLALPGADTESHHRLDLPEAP